MLSERFLMDAHRKVDLSGSLAASGGGIHHVMTGRRGCDVSACPERPAPVSLMRLPVTGDVVVRGCVCGSSQRLNKCIVSMTSVILSAASRQPYVAL